LKGIDLLGTGGPISYGLEYSMGKALRQIKRGAKAAPFEINKLEIAFNKGYSAGAREQRESDIDYVIQLLENLEDVPGIGQRTADKVREYFLKKFGSSQLGG
jgi:hypothetical protein